MSIEIKNIELVDRYLSGDLNAAEQQAFQARLQSDGALQELLSDFQATSELVKANEMAQIKAQLDSFSYEAAPWWQSTTAKFVGAVAVTAVVTTAVWVSVSNEKTAAKETVAVVKTESVKEKNRETTTAQKETRQQQTKTVVDPPHLETEPSSNFPFVYPAIIPVDSVKEENAAPLTPVTTPTGPVAPPQRDPVVSPSDQGNKTTTPADNNKQQPEPTVTAPEPVKRNFSIQLLTQSWTYPDHMKNGNLRILNESGALINELNLNASTDSWNGTDRYGNTVPSGLYFYEYTDVSGQHYSGTITVVY